MSWGKRVFGAFLGLGMTLAGCLAVLAEQVNYLPGNIGEYVSSTVLVGAAISLTTNTAADITSVSLTPGQWSCSGNIAFAAASGTAPTSLISWISASSATLPTAPNSGAEQILNLIFQTGVATQLIATGPLNVSISATTTYFLSARAIFTVSTMTSYGFIGCTRIK